MYNINKMRDRPALKAYEELQYAYDYFNKKLFKNELPDLILTLQRGKNTYGYFAPERFDGKSKLSELAMNPDYFGNRTLAETLSTLVHEMCHVWQHYLDDKKMKQGYHDKRWGVKMKEVGLMPSNTGLPGGRQTGQQMTHYIMKDGAFQKCVYEMLKEGFSISWYDKWHAVHEVSVINKDILDDWIEKTDPNDVELINKVTKTLGNREVNVLSDEDEHINIVLKPSKKDNNTRNKFTCPKCALNAWAKPSARLMCEECDERLVVQEY